MLSLVPTVVWEPVTLYVAPSSPTNPSPLTVTFEFFNAVPSYTFSALALVNLTVRLLIVTVASSFNV